MQETAKPRRHESKGRLVRLLLRQLRGCQRRALKKVAYDAALGMDPRSGGGKPLLSPECHICRSATWGRVGVGFNHYPSTSSINRVIFAESIPPFSSSRVTISVPAGPPPSSWGLIPASRY